MKSQVFLMVQITATIDNETIKKVDQVANATKISRSKWIALAIQFYLQYTGPRDTVSPSMKIQGSVSSVSGDNFTMSDPGYLKMQESVVTDTRQLEDEIAQLTRELEGKNQIIKLQVDEIGWLRGECSKLTDRFIFALPAPKKKWWEFWKKGEK